MLKKLSSRFSLLEAYRAPGRDFPFSAVEVVKGIVKAPCTQIGPRLIETQTREGDFSVVSIKGVTRPLYWPQSLPTFDLYKVVTECFYQDDWHFYEVPETRVRPGDCVVDCGAAEGVFSLRVHERAGRVFAFEPNPLFVESMRRTFAGATHVEVIPLALGRSNGEVAFKVDSLYGSVSEEDDVEHLRVRMVTLDTWCAERGGPINYIKADLESAEMELLHGAVETIKRFKPTIAMTTYHEGNNWRDMLRFCRELAPGYQFFVKGLSYAGATPRPVMIHLWHES